MVHLILKNWKHNISNFLKTSPDIHLVMQPFCRNKYTARLLNCSLCRRSYYSPVMYGRRCISPQTKLMHCWTNKIRWSSYYTVFKDFVLSAQVQVRFLIHCDRHVILPLLTIKFINFRPALRCLLSSFVMIKYPTSMRILVQIIVRYLLMIVYCRI